MSDKESDQDDMIVTDNALSAEQRRGIEILVGMMIPASVEYGVPGADDTQILGDILARARDLPVVIQGLNALGELANARRGEPFSELEGDVRVALVEELRATQVAFVRLLTAITAQCYYRDARVVDALGMEARAPFPQGFVVEEGDWSLLEPVRRRPPLYRECP